jgi:hypothetical protein
MFKGVTRVLQGCYKGFLRIQPTWTSSSCFHITVNFGSSTTPHTLRFGSIFWYMSISLRIGAGNPAPVRE